MKRKGELHLKGNLACSLICRCSSKHSQMFGDIRWTGNKGVNLALVRWKIKVQTESKLHGYIKKAGVPKHELSN